MTHTSIADPSAVGFAEPIDGEPFGARTMGKPFSSSENRNMKDSGEHLQASRLPAGHVDLRHNRPGIAATYTLRIKPDRRRAQVPIPPGTDRRRSR
jgi:hypothetical protein